MPNMIFRIVSKASTILNATQGLDNQSRTFRYGDISFSFREAQCIHYLLKNYSAKQTSKQLNISPKTVEFHIARVKNKLNCNTKSQIVDKAIELGFIDLMLWI